MNEQIVATYSATWHLYPFLPAAYMSFLDHHPNARVFVFINDEKLPYDTPENVEVVDCRKQKFFNADNCVNWGTGFQSLTLMRGTYAKLFTGKPNRYGIRTLPYVDKIFQLDVDTYVMENLAPIWNLDMTDHYFAATQEYLSVNKPRPRYWNLGFALFSLYAIRRDGIDDRVIDDLRKIKYPWIDQDAFCKVGDEHPEKVYDLGVRYNECNQTGWADGRLPAVAHLCAQGPEKFTRDSVPRIEQIQKYRQYYRIDECRRAGIFV